MLYSVYINQLFVAGNPSFDGLDFNDVAIFDCMRKLITGTWGGPDDKEIRGGVVWAHVPVKLISQQLPLLRDSQNRPWKLDTISRRVRKLCDCGLILMDGKDNKKRAKAFYGLGQASKDYDSIKPPSDVNPMVGENGQKPSDINPQTIGYKSVVPSDINPIYNNISNNIKNDIPPTPLDGVSGETPPTGKKSKVKRNPGRKEVEEFYEDERRKSLKDPLPPEEAAAAAARGLAQSRLAAGYSEIVDYMTKPSDMWPAGMWACVLTRTHQLSFLQFCKLILVQGMTRVVIKDYLDQWENKQYDNGNIYATFCKWWSNQKTGQTNGNGHRPATTVTTVATLTPRGPQGE